MLKAVIFDMDGLMFDSEALALQLIAELMDEHQYENNDDINRSVIGMNRTLSEQIYTKHYGEDFPYTSFMQARRDRTMTYYGEFGVPKKEGLVELLTFLKDNGIKIALATSTYREEAEFMLEKANVLSFFDRTVCGDEVPFSKPDPAIYNQALSLLNVKPQEALVLEDSENGLRAAQAAGISTVFVKDLVMPQEEVLKATTHQKESLAEVIAIVKKMLIAV